MVTPPGADIKERYCFALIDAASKSYTERVKALLPVQGSDKRDYSLSSYWEMNYFKTIVALVEALRIAWYEQ